MHAASTVVTAGSVRPNQSVSARTHTISKTSAEAPETRRSGATDVEEGGVTAASMTDPTPRAWPCCSGVFPIPRVLPPTGSSFGPRQLPLHVRVGLRRPSGQDVRPDLGRDPRRVPRAGSEVARRLRDPRQDRVRAVSYTHLRAH